MLALRGVSGAEPLAYVAGHRTNDPFENEEADEAAAEAGAIGGVAGDEDLDPADRPLVEAGEGEAEGFELAEDDLIEHASHGDQHSGLRPLLDEGDAEESRGRRTARATTRAPATTAPTIRPRPTEGD